MNFRPSTSTVARSSTRDNPRKSTKSLTTSAITEIPIVSH